MAILRVVQGNKQETLRFEGTPFLSDLLLAHGYDIVRPCGGRGLCGKCAVTLGGRVAPMTAAERRAGTHLSCQAVLLGDCEAHLPDDSPLAQIALNGSETRADKHFSLSPLSPHTALGAAVDIGTTTVALKLFSLEDGCERAAAAMRNPQTAVAADVMGRVGAAMNGQQALLKRQGTDAVTALLAEACRRADCLESQVRRFVVTGNTAMLYLLTGRDPQALSRSPFLVDCLFGLEERLLDRPVYFPPCMSAFVGADITCAALSSGMCERRAPALLCDLGTNGELALWKDGVLSVASTAAGPAFEGAGVAMGVASVRGAIDRVWLEDGRLCAHTIGDAPAVGVCGSGLLDAVAALLRLGMIDETGAAQTESLPLAGGISLYPRDIRNVQLAKAAIAAGIQVLLSEAQTAPGSLARLYVAGGFGSRLNLQSAAEIGLLPETLVSRASVIGNAALTGAAQLLLNDERRRDATAIAALARPVALGGNPRFNDAYIEHMLFPA